MTAAAPPIGNENKQDFDQAYDRLIESERFQTEMSPFEVPEPDPPLRPGLQISSNGWERWAPVWEALFWMMQLWALAD